jgi:hypothetical protein
LIPRIQKQYSYIIFLTIYNAQQFWEYLHTVKSLICSKFISMFLSNELILRSFYHICITIPSALVPDKKYKPQRLDSIIRGGRWSWRVRLKRTKGKHFNWQRLVTQLTLGLGTPTNTVQPRYYKNL